MQTIVRARSHFPKTSQKHLLKSIEPHRNHRGPIKAIGSSLSGRAKKVFWAIKVLRAGEIARITSSSLGSRLLEHQAPEKQLGWTRNTEHRGDRLPQERRKDEKWVGQEFYFLEREMNWFFWGWKNSEENQRHMGFPLLSCIMWGYIDITLACGPDSTSNGVVVRCFLRLLRLS